MSDTFIISIVTFVYFAAAFSYLISFVFSKKPIAVAALVLTVSGITAQTAAFIIRWVHSYQLGIGHIPLANFYESVVFFSWSIIPELQHEMEEPESGEYSFQPMLSTIPGIPFDCAERKKNVKS